MEAKSDKKNGEEDAKYVVACQSGDETAWNALYFKYRPKLIRFFKNKGIVHEDAEELTQDTLLEAFKWIGTIQKPKGFNKWLFTIAERKGIQSSYTYQQPERKQPERIAIDSERRQIVYGLIAKLPENQRDVIRLRVVEELSSKEIAERLNLKVGNVEVLLHRARKALKKQLRTKYPEIAEDAVTQQLI